MPFSDDWAPFSKRALDSSAPYEALVPGVPAHLSRPLRRWLSDVLTPNLAERVNLRLRREGGHPAEVELAAVDSGILLDVVDAALAVGVGDGEITELDVLLEEGGSAYKVSPHHGMGLEHRVDPAVLQTFRATLRRAGDGRPHAANHLDLAWKHAYALHPDPTRAYLEAVKAVEAAVVPVVIPSDQIPTLGKAIASLRDGAANWMLVITTKDGSPAPVEPVAQMLSLVWEGQSDRHAGGPQTAPVTQASAEAAVHLAAMLVQWFVAGVVRRPDSE